MRDGPTIAVIGNCQGRGVAHAMRLLAPRARIRFLHMEGLRRDFGRIDDLAASLAGCDHVASQVFAPGLVAGGDAWALCERLPRTTLLPTIVFSAFHPDMVYVGRTSGSSATALLPSPLGLYHSAIALCAYRLGLTAAEAVVLYREEVFSALGYLDHWQPAARDLLANASALGFGLDRELVRWSRRGAFMHVMNHPKAFVLSDLAGRFLDQAGLPSEPVTVEDYLADPLADDVVWPLYPPIAEAYGLTGSYLFKSKRRGHAFPALYDLYGFVSASFTFYAASDPAKLACARVDAWLTRPEIVGVFDAARS